MKLFPAGVCALAALLLAGCSLAMPRAEREHAYLAAVHAAAGKPVDSFTFVSGSLYSWRPLDENEVLVYTRPRKAWLLNVGLCPELPYTPTIGLTSHVGRVSVMTDSVLVARGHFPCRIQKIQPVDVDQLKQAMAPRKGGTITPAKASS
ncbi:MAG TPA: DUF6491 family protein [Rhodanobacteraceae bacterium]